MIDIALGFANTVDVELCWDAVHLERLIEKTGLRAGEIQEKKTIESLKDLLASILFHLQNGSGCGMMLSDPQIIEQFLEGSQGTVTLGGTDIRAALVIAKMGGRALVHLSCVNPETVERLPEGVEWVGTDHFRCCYPHVAVQYPALARVRWGDVDVTAPRANRVIYSADIACARLQIAPAFFERAQGAKVLVLSSFDLILEETLLRRCLDDVKRGVGSLPDPRPLIFYEHACFASRPFGLLVGQVLGDCIDVYSMNEDEFMDMAGMTVDLLDARQVYAGLTSVAGQIPARTILVHTRHWVLAYGGQAHHCAPAMAGGMAVAATRYGWGDVSPEGLENVMNLPRQGEAAAFALRIEEMSASIRCLPAYQVEACHATTIGLGDSFVGGFALAYARAPIR